MNLLTQYKQILLVVEYENQPEYEYHEFPHIYKNDFPIFQLLLIRLLGFNILKSGASSRWWFARGRRGWFECNNSDEMTMAKKRPTLIYLYNVRWTDLGCITRFYK